MSDKIEGQSLLHYGCLVYFTYKDEHGKEYYVTADGYTKNKIQLKSKDDILHQSSIQASLFKIYPTFFNNEYVKARKKYEEKRRYKKFSTIERRGSINLYKYIFKEARAEIPKQIKAMEEETLLNYEQYEKFKGSPVIFGQTIQLLHVNSNKYLFYDMNHVSEYESNNLKVGLKDEYSEETCYRILPCYTFQQEGSGNIHDEDIVNIVSTVDQIKKIGGEPFVHASKAKQSEKGKYKREVNISTEKKTPWKIHIFSEYIDEREGFLSVQDSIWINFSEQDLNLVIKKNNQNDNFPGANLIQDEQQVAKFDITNYIQFENCETTAENKFVGSSNGMFTIESEMMFKGGMVRWSTPENRYSYRLRHLTTREYLVVVPVSETDYAVTTVQSYQEASLFNFELIYSTLTSYNRDKAQIFLQKDSYFRLWTMAKKFAIDQEQQGDAQEAEVWLRIAKLSQNQQNSNDEQDMDSFETQVPMFSEIKKEEYVFKLAKVNFNEVRMTSFLLSCLKTITSAENYLTPAFLTSQNLNDDKFQQRYKSFLVHIARLEKCLCDLYLFCHNKLIAYLYIDQEYGQVNTFIQNVLREQLFIEMLIKMLCVSFPNYDSLNEMKELETDEGEAFKLRSAMGEEQKRSKQAIQQQIKKEFFQRKKKVCGLIYKLLGGVCENNTYNQEAMSKYLPVIAQQSLFINQGLDCIIMIIKDYEELLLTIHKQVDDQQGQHHKSIQQRKSIPVKAKKKGKKSKKGGKSTIKPEQSQHQQLEVNPEVYKRQYNKIVDGVKSGNFDIEIKWDLILFFTNLLRDKDRNVQEKRDLISFLEFSCTFEGKGVNINQERVHSYLMNLCGGLDQLFENEVLIKIQTENKNNEIKVYFMGEERAFLEFFSQNKKQPGQKGKIALDQDIGQSKALTVFLKKQGVTTPSQQIPGHLVLNLISEQIDFYSSMCNSRNNTWKTMVEQFLPADVLINNIVDQRIGYDMRAVLSRLLNKLYVDQEPRRVMEFPELCKILRRQAMELIDDTDKGEEIIDDFNLKELKEQLLKFIGYRKDRAEKLTEQIELKDSEISKLDKLRAISNESGEIYNKLTLEVVRLTKVLIDFGKFNLKMGQDEQQTQAVNQDFFGLIQSIFVLLEFDTTYPEGRKILLEQRKEDSKQRNLHPTKLLGNMMGMLGGAMAMFDIFGMMDDNNDKDKKKKTKAIQNEGEAMNMNESFLKQSNVLKKILSRYLQEGNDMDLLIKLEICDILDKYLDQKMDFCLNIFTQKFKEYINKLKLIEQLENGELNFNDEKKTIIDKLKGVFTNCIEAIIPPIMRTGTSIDKSDPKLNQEEISFGFGNLANLAGNITGGIGRETVSKNVEAIDINRILDFEIFPSLITLFCMTHSLSMETKILNILTRFYNQRLEFAELTSKMLLLLDEVNINIFTTLKQRIRKLAKNIDESETWLENLHIPDSLMTLKQTQDFFEYFNDLLYADSYLDSSEHVVCTQREKVDPIRQGILRNLKAFDLAITLIRDNISQACNEIHDNETLDHIRGLFISAFKFLRNFVIDNSQNQNVLSNYLVVFLVNMETDLGQVALINEIFRNNKRICIEKSHILIDDFINLIITNGRQAKYLEFFLIIQKVKNDYISSNQKAVLNIFMDPKNKHQIFALRERQHSKHHHDKGPQVMLVKQEFDFEVQNKIENPNYIDEPYIYHSKLIEVLYNCAIGKEGMLQNETRLRNMISFKYAMEVLSAPDNFVSDLDMNMMSEIIVEEKKEVQKSRKQSDQSEHQSVAEQENEGRQTFDRKIAKILKQPMLNYIFYTYLESEKISEDIFKCIPDVQYYIQFEKRRIDMQRTIPLNNEFLEYFFSTMMMCMNALMKIYQKELREQNLIHTNQQVVHQQIEALMNDIRELRQSLDESEWVKEIVFTEGQQRLLKYFYSDDIALDEVRHQEELIAEEQRKQEELLAQQQAEEMQGNKKKKKKVNSGFTLNPFTQNKTKQKPINFSQDEAWKQLWSVYLETFLESKELKSEIEAEHLIFAKALDKVEQIFAKDAMMAEHINKNELFKKLITFLLKGHEIKGTTNTQKQVLQALSNYIVISSENVDPMAEEEEKDKLAQIEKESHQNFLNGNNAMTVVLQLLSDYRDPDRSNAIYNHLISFGIMLLDGGNREVQKSVYNFFLNYTSSEVFFLRLHEKFDQECIECKKEDETDDSIVVYGFQKSSNEILNTMRFMQLFAEGHYAELQNYMRLQQMNYHSYDLFTDVVEILGSYLYVNNPKYFDNMVQCFETITEYVQGPCFDNQIALFQANFMDMASNLLTVDEIIDELDRNMKSKQLQNKNEDLMVADTTTIQKKAKVKEVFPRWMIARLKYKCSITLLSLLEARKNNENVIRLIKSLNLDVLKRNMVDVFQMFHQQYKENYSEEIFQHFDSDPESDEQAELDKSSFIIQTGFNLFVLYSIFVEYKESTDEDDGKPQEQAEEEDKLQDFLKNNIVGQIMSLFLSILEGIKDTMLEMKNQAQEAIMGKGGEQELSFETMKQQIFSKRLSVWKKALKFFGEHTAQIEVLREDKMLEKTYFYLPPFCFSLDKETKTMFNEGANRISVKAKVTSLLQESEDLIKKMKLNYQLAIWLNKIKFLAVIVSNIQLLRDIAFILALVINILVLVEWRKDIEGKTTPIKSAIITMGTIVIVLSMIIVGFFLAKTAPLIIKKAWVGVKQDKLNLVKYLKRLLMTIFLLISDFYVLYYIIYGLTAVIGTIYTPFFFAFHLFDVLVRFPVLLNVVKAVWQPKKAIMFTFFLLIVLMYVFTLFAYYWLDESYQPNYCDSTWKCLLTSYDRSFKSDGGLGGYIKPSTEVKPDDTGYFMVRFFFDNIFFILLLIIMINIVAGIIIDTFGTLREELNEYNQDLENFCFICGFDKETIEKHSKNQRGFSYHIKKEHYLWNYLYYIAYIMDKESTELSGIESYVVDKIENEDISWFPTFKALCMNDDTEEQDSAVVIKQLQKVQEEQSKLKSILENINEQLEQLEQDYSSI